MLSGRNKVRFALLVGVLMAMAVPSFAVDPTVDYAALAGASKTEILNSIVAAAPVVFATLAVLLGVSLAFRWIKKAAKAS
jgi:hypothetical protein